MRTESWKRNLVALWIGQTLTMVGVWMQYIAISWLMYRLTHSAFMLGMTGFALQIPILLISPFAGVWVDRYSRRKLLLVAAVSMTTSPYQHLMPIFAGQVFGGDARTLGMLISGAGLGALAGTAYLAGRTSLRGLSRIIVGASFSAGIGLMLFSQSRQLWLSLALMLPIGFGLIVTATSTNTILQTVADEDKRGRVVAIYGMCFLGAAPIGNFIAGSVASRIGAPYTLFVLGALCTLAAASFALRLQSWREAIRPVYLRLGVVQ